MKSEKENKNVKIYAILFYVFSFVFFIMLIMYFVGKLSSMEVSSDEALKILQEGSNS
jgi:hypothetical protein